jgi:hypothetical protein
VPGDVKERGFSDSGLAADQECRPTLIDPIKEMIEQSYVLLAALQERRRKSNGARRLFPSRNYFFVRLAIA